MTRRLRPQITTNAPFDSNTIEPSVPRMRESCSPRSGEGVSQEWLSVPTAPPAYSTTTSVLRSGPWDGPAR